MFEEDDATDEDVMEEDAMDKDVVTGEEEEEGEKLVKLLTGLE